VRKWLSRYQRYGLKDVESQSRRPHNSPFQKINPDIEQLIVELRSRRNLGAIGVKNELFRHNELSISLKTIHKVLHQYDFQPIETTKDFIRYERAIPGKRIQMNTSKIAPGINLQPLMTVEE
jgi:transposase